MMTSSALFATVRNETPPRGLTALKVGDMLDVGGNEGLAVVEYVNDCRARCRPLEKQSVRVTTRFGKQAEFSVDRSTINIAVLQEPGTILKRLGKDGLEQFLATQTARRSEFRKVTRALIGNQTESNNSMKNKTSSTEPKAPRQGGLGLLLGFSVASVVRALGAAGVKGSQVMRILEANKIKASRPGIQTMVFNGRHGIGGEPAPVTKKQIEELISMDPGEPATESEKPAKAPKAKKPVKAAAKAKKPAKAKKVAEAAPEADTTVPVTDDLPAAD